MTGITSQITYLVN